MPTSTRFAISVHLLALLAENRKTPMTSEALSQSVNTNPAVVRRLLSMLAQAGLTQSRLGKGGGTLLAKGPKKISMAAIYQAVETPGLIATHRGKPDPDCPIGRRIEISVSAVANEAESAFLESLHQKNLKQVVREIAAQNAAA